MTPAAPADGATPPTAPQPTPSTLWAVVGATGTGKTALSLALAEALQRRGRRAEIVNADAMQLYRGMDIGTAKLPVAERRGIAHHLFDALEVTDEAAVAAYQRRAREVIAGVFAQGGDAILVGGSGLYVSSVLFDFRFPPHDEALRAELEAALAASGPGALLQRLRDLDPSAAARVDPHNARRIVRALEVAISGGDFAGALPSEPSRWHQRTRIIGVALPRAELVARLDERVVSMWRAGLVDEAAALRTAGLDDGVTARRAIGYAQALAQLDGELDEAEATATTQALTRRYARRQVSWFKRYRGVEWVAPDVDVDALLDEAGPAPA